MGYFEVGLVCLNGHEVNSRSKYYPEFNTEFCKQCGEPTIRNCMECFEEIQGYYQDTGDICMGSEWNVPKHCHSCGTPYPWTQRKNEALIDTIGLMNEISIEESTQLVDSIPDIIAETPKTQNAIIRFNRAISKCGIVGGKILYDAVISVAGNIIAGEIMNPESWLKR